MADWSLLRVPDFGATFMQAFEQGRERKRQDETRNALMAYAQNPSEQGLNALAQYAPEVAIQERGRFQQQQIAAQERQTDLLPKVGRLLSEVQKDPSKYGMIRSAAIQMGFDPAAIPETYDPAWVQQQAMVAQALAADGGAQISGLARELADAGYVQGTPEFAQAMRSVISNKYASDYVDEAGNVRRRSALDLGQPAAPEPQPSQGVEPLTFEQYQGAVNGLGPQGASAWLSRNNFPVRVMTPAQARTLPRGTRIILPDGSEGRVP